MKKLKIISLFILIVSIVMSYWVIEPFYFTPFKSIKPQMVESEFIYNSTEENINHHILKLKADSIVNSSIMMNDFIGVSAGVYSYKDGIYVANAGYSSKRNKERSHKNTLYRTASIAKPLTAVAIMQLWERDKIELDVPIQTYLPEFPVKEKGVITIGQLLNHTSGVRHYNSNWDGISFTHYKTLIEALDEFKNDSLKFKPGEGYEYTTYGYTILGAIIEKVTGLSYQQYMKDNIFTPASMSHTDIEESAKEYDNKADLYIKFKNSYIKSPKTDLSVKYPGGGFHTTAEDLLRFGAAITEYALIDSLTLEQMISSTSPLKQGTPYGFGWFVLEDEVQGRVLQHGGSQSGASTFFKILLDRKIVSVALANNFGSDEGVYWLSRDLAELAIQNDFNHFDLDYFSYQSDDVLDQYVGKYSNGKDTFVISKNDSQLYSQNKNYPTLPIYPKSKNHFFFRHFTGEMTFDVLSDDRKVLYYYHKGVKEEFIKQD